ncbi:hypothetical protein N9O21_01880 [Rhodobacteraceae bacterium]|nr:hypothetical protein [Paracoccaceae bacterium]
MTDQKCLIPHDQFKALQCDIADAMLHAQMIDPGYYYIELENGDQVLTEDGQDEFNEHYDSAEIMLNDNGIYSVETPPDG